VACTKRIIQCPLGRRLEKEGQPRAHRQNQGLIGIELPESEYELLKEQAIEQVQKRYESSNAEIAELIQAFKDKGHIYGFHIWKTSPASCSPKSKYG